MHEKDDLAEKWTKLQERSTPTTPEKDSLEQAIYTEWLETDEVQDYFAFVDAITKAAEEGQPEARLPIAFLARALRDDAFQPHLFKHLQDIEQAVRARRQGGRAGN